MPIKSGRGRILATLGLATGLSLVAASATVAQARCRDDLVRVEGDWGHANFTVQVADDNEERMRGLMFVEEMGMLEGMLFVFDAPQRASFWMRNTLIPLDMLFIAEDGTISTVKANAVPLDETPIFGGDDIAYVLEINGGMAARLGIEPGDVIQHPALGPDAAMPCDD